MIMRSKRVYAQKSFELPLNDRKNFKLVSRSPDRESILKEAGRCLYCDELCDICTTVCPNFANYSYGITPVRYELQCAERNEDGTVEIKSDEVFEVRQKYQILNIANFCNECGNCDTFCPTGSAPYREKPAFWLTISSFNSAEEGYYLARLQNRKNLIFKKQENITTLTELAEEYLFETDDIFVRFGKIAFQLLEVKFKTTHVKKVHFRHAAEMSILLNGADTLLFE
jgi:putative selenate reductase